MKKYLALLAVCAASFQLAACASTDDGSADIADQAQVQTEAPAQDASAPTLDGTAETAPAAVQ